MKKMFLFLLLSFSILKAQDYECTITVNSPKEGDIWYVGNTYEILWSFTSYCPSYLSSIKLFGMKNNREYLLDTLWDVENDGNQTYKPLSSSAGYDFCYFKFFAESGGHPYLRTPSLVGISPNFYIIEMSQEDFSIFPNFLSFLLEENSNSLKNFYIIPKAEMVNFVISSSQNWISVNPNSGTASFGNEPFKIILSVSSQGLDVGEYDGEVVVFSQNSSTTKTLKVFMKVVPKGTGNPKLELDNNKIYFNFKLGEPPSPYYINLRNIGDGEAYFLIDEFSSFLNFSPLRGYLKPGESIKITVSINGNFELISTKKGFATLYDQKGNKLFIYCFANAYSDYYSDEWSSSSTPSKTLPIAATGLGGAYGSFWATDVYGVLMSPSFEEFLINASKGKISYELNLREKAQFIFGAISGKVRGREAQVTQFELSDGFPSLFVDFLGNFLGLQSTSSFIQARGDLAGRLALNSRTYTTDSQGNTYGQFIGTPPESEILGSGGGKAIVFGLRNDVNFRSNIFITELDGYSTEVILTLYNHLGQKIGNPLTKTLEGFTQWQIIDVFSKAGADANWAYAEIQSNGAGRIYAFGSVIDKQTNDPYTLPGVVPSSKRTFGNLYMPGIVKAKGGYGTNWRTDLVFMNGSSSGLTVEVEFYTNTGGNPEKKYINLLPNSMGIYIDALKSLFDKDEGLGSIIVRNVNTSNFYLHSRIYNLMEGGKTYGQGAMAFKIEEGTWLGELPIYSMGLEESQNFRTNLGIFEISGNSAKILFTLIFPDGESRNFFQNVNPYEWIQINNIKKTKGGYDLDVSNVWIIVSVIEGSGTIVAYNSIVDNNSSDATFMRFIKP